MSTDLAVRYRPVLVGLAALRAVLALIAIPLAPVLYEDHVVALVLLRPSKEVLLLAGFAAREEGVNLALVVAAALPLMVMAVWVFYGLGRAYRDELEDAELPGLAGRVLPPKRVERFREALHARGLSLVFLGRLALMPSTLVAAAGGSAGVDARTFLLADLAGALVSMTMILGAGWALGSAYEEAGPWLTVVSGVAVLAVLVVFGHHLTRARPKAAPAG